MTHEAGKGDTQRPTDFNAFSKNFDAIFKITEKRLAELEEEEDDEDELCSACSGSGEGMYDGDVCRVCKGYGHIAPEKDDDI